MEIIRRLFRPSRTRKSGIAALEFALVLPGLMLILFGIINFAILLYDHAVVTNAAREAARWQVISTNTAKPGNSRGYSVAKTHCTDALVVPPTLPQHVACNYLHGKLINPAGGTVPEVEVSSDSPANPTQVIVTVSYDFGWIGYLDLADMFNGGSATAVMYYE